MSSTGPMRVSQASPCDDKETPKTRSFYLRPSPLPLHPDERPSSTQGCVLNPPVMGPRRLSPIKAHRQPSITGSGRNNLGFVSITAPPPQMFTTDSPTKKSPTLPHTHSTASVRQSALFTTFSSLNPDKKLQNESQSTSLPPNDGHIDFSNPPHGPKAPPKRPLLEAAPLKEKSTKKQKREDTPSIRLPEPHEMPPIEDDGTKPPYSYATLIGMSILRAPNRRMTLAQIYKWISDTFSYYKNSDSGWQNSIRHNLSLNKAFVKQERPKDDPGKGNYWAIEPGMEAQFLKDKPLRRATMSSFPLPPVPRKDSTLHSRDTSRATWIVPPASSYPSTTAKSTRKVELSSDATLPASDPALQEDTSDESTNVLTSQAPHPRSSSPQAIHSSPPVAPPRFIREGTPPTPSRRTAPSGMMPGPRKRKPAVLNDSGYFSSLDSSARRSNKGGHMLTSDLDIEPLRIKRGRAEEEIARIRSSSNDISPGHSGILKDTSLLVGSSPFRGEYVNMLPPPLTPVVKFKKPARPPPSVSPNTNLRNHRKKIQHMVNSPIKHLGLTDEDLPWSPAFNIQDEEFTPNENSTSFDVFADSAGDNIFTPVYGSPEKRSTKRRPNSARVGSNILADITAVNVNSRMGLSSSNKSKGLVFPDSPSKLPEDGHFVDASNDEFFSFHLFDESPGEVDGVDLLQGFQKIGGTSKDHPSNSKGHISRPPLNQRGNASLF